MYYCDGASFSGDLEAPVKTAGGKVPPQIYFRGPSSTTSWAQAPSQTETFCIIVK